MLTNTQGPTLGGQAFIGSNQASERATDVLDAVVRVTGAKGYKIHDPTNRTPSNHMRVTDPC